MNSLRSSERPDRDLYPYMIQRGQPGMRQVYAGYSATDTKSAGLPWPPTPQGGKAAFED